MRMLRCLFAVVLVCGLTRLAKADDFKDVIVDPTVPLDLIQEVTSDDFTVEFPDHGPCGWVPGQPAPRSHATPRILTPASPGST